MNQVLEKMNEHSKPSHAMSKLHIQIIYFVWYYFFYDNSIRIKIMELKENNTELNMNDKINEELVNTNDNTYEEV